MTVYTSQIATALRLITAKGQDVTFTRRTATGYDEDSDTTATHTAKAVVLPASASSMSAMAKAYAEAAAAENNILVLIVAASGLSMTPRPGDTVTGIDSLTWEVMANSPLAPDGTAIIHQLLIRR